VNIAPLNTVIAPVLAMDEVVDADILDKIHVRDSDVLLLSGSLVCRARPRPTSTSASSHPSRTTGSGETPSPVTSTCATTPTGSA